MGSLTAKPEAPCFVKAVAEAITRCAPNQQCFFSSVFKDVIAQFLRLIAAEARKKMIEPEAVMFRHLSSFNWKGTCEGQCEACKAGPEPDFQNSVLPVVDAVCQLMRDYMVHAVGSAFTGLANKPANQGHIRKDQHVDDAPTSCNQTLDDKSQSGGSKAMFRTIRNNFSCSLLRISNNFSCSLLYWGLRIVGLLSGGLLRVCDLWVRMLAITKLASCQTPWCQHVPRVL